MTDSVEARAILKNENVRKFRELQDYLEEQVPQHISEKTGQAATVRLAIRMAHDQMQKNNEELEQGKQQVEDVRGRIEKQAENI
jgi:hypothetical protein